MKILGMGEIPSIRFDRARKEGNSLFTLFALPKPYTSTKDVLCLRGKRMVNGYRKIFFFNNLEVISGRDDEKNIRTGA